MGRSAAAAGFNTNRVSPVEVDWSAGYRTRVERVLADAGLRETLDLDGLQRAASLLLVPRNAMIWTARDTHGAQTDRALLVISGTVRIESSFGTTRVYHRLCGPGALLGLSVLFGAATGHSATVCAADDKAVVLLIDGEFLRGMLVDKSWRMFLLRQMRDLIARLSDEVATLHHPNYEVRVLRVLLRMQDAAHIVAGGWHRFSLTLNDLAHLIGVSSPNSVRRILRRLQRVRCLRRATSLEDRGATVQLHLQRAKKRLAVLSGI